MAPRQKELCILMPGESEGGRLVSLQIVAALAAIEVRCRGKLPGMLVAVAIGAALEFYLEQRVFALRDMALRTLQPGMLAFKRIR
jgi:hypothetical protein